METPAARIGGLLLFVVLVIAIAWFTSDRGPREADRVTHPAGYSVIPPKGFDATMETTLNDPKALDRMRMWPIKFLGDMPSVIITRLRGPQNADELHQQGLSDVKFQKEPAYMSDVPKPTRRIVRIVFQRGGNWFQADLVLPGLEGEKLDQYLSYLETFRYPAQPSAPATNAPATSAPATSASHPSGT